MSPEHQKEPTQPKPSIARRFGGLVFGVTGSRNHLASMTAKELAVEQENKVLDERQNAHLRSNLFRIVGPSTPENIRWHTDLSSYFLDVLAEKETIAERFNLFRQPFFAPFLSSMDIGETKRPDSHGEVEALKEEYHALLKQLVEEGVIKGELQRAKAKPTIHLSLNPQVDYVSATRNRDLFSYTDGMRSLSISKRMTFLMPREAVGAFPVPSHGRLHVPEVLKVQKLIDAQDAESIIPVRTVYYAKNKPLEKSKE